MRGERYQNGMVMLLTGLVFAAIPLLVNLPAWWFLCAPVEAALRALPAAFLRGGEIGTSPRSPGDGRRMAASAAASTPSASDQVRGLLVGSLSFGLHMAEQAYEAQRKAYTDARVLAVLGAFVLWTVLLVGLFLALNGLNLLTGRWETPIIGATSAAFLTGGVLLAGMRRRYGPPLSRYGGGEGRPGDAPGRGRGRKAPPPGAAGSVAILLPASTPIPDWLPAPRQARLGAAPGSAVR